MIRDDLKIAMFVERSIVVLLLVWQSFTLIVFYLICPDKLVWQRPETLAESG